MLRQISASEMGLPGERHYSIRGSVPRGPRLAIVGSRACHRQLASAVAPVVEALADADWSMVSGGALGIDGHAHRESLERRVPQFAVLPCGPGRAYPPQHDSLFEGIAGMPGSGLLYALERGQSASRGVFAGRNRIVVGLCKALLVVEAGARSGSEGTGRLGLKAGVPTAVIEGSRGCSKLACAGARRFGWSGDGDELRGAIGQWLDAVLDGRAGEGGGVSRNWPEELVWLRDELTAAGGRGRSLDELGGSLPAIVALTEAETLGLVEEVAPGRYVVGG